MELTFIVIILRAITSLSQQKVNMSSMGGEDEKCSWLHSPKHHSNDETQISLQVLPVPLQNLRFCARVSSQILLAFSQVLQETPALAPSPTKKTAPQFLRRFHSKTCKVTLFSRLCTQNLRASHFLAICPFPTNTAKPATHPTKSAIDSGSI